jgi:hypothetical protein
MWVSADCPLTYVVNAPDLTVAWWSGTQWNDVGPASISGDAISGNIISQPTANSGYFSLASYSSLNPLPIELRNFNAKGISSGIELTWETLTELNTNYFQIERADASLRFDSIGVITAAGQSAESREYLFNDMHPFIGKNYYRLKTIDNDGSAGYSAVVVCEKTTEGAFNVFPNPVNRGEKVHFSAQGIVRIYSPHRPAMIMQVDGQLFIDTSELSPGPYIAVDQANTYFRFIVL